MGWSRLVKRPVPRGGADNINTHKMSKQPNKQTEQNRTRSDQSFRTQPSIVSTSPVTTVRGETSTTIKKTTYLYLLHHGQPERGLPQPSLDLPDLKQWVVALHVSRIVAFVTEGGAGRLLANRGARLCHRLLVCFVVWRVWLGRLGSLGCVLPFLAGGWFVQVAGWFPPRWFLVAQVGSSLQSWSPPFYRHEKLKRPPRTITPHILLILTPVQDHTSNPPCVWRDHPSHDRRVDHTDTQPNHHTTHNQHSLLCLVLPWLCTRYPTSYYSNSTLVSFPHPARSLFVSRGATVAVQQKIYILVLGCLSHCWQEWGLELTTDESIARLASCLWPY
jgi:hypothetical protein